MRGKKAKELRKKAQGMAKRNDIKDVDKVYRVMKKIVKSGVLSVLLFCFVSPCFGAEIIIPFNNCYPKKVQESFAKRGYKVDLSANDRTKESVGFIENRGTQWLVITYEIDVTDEKFSEDLKEIVWEQFDE